MLVGQFYEMPVKMGVLQGWIVALFLVLDYLMYLASNIKLLVFTDANT